MRQRISEQLIQQQKQKEKKQERKSQEENYLHKIQQIQKTMEQQLANLIHQHQDDIIKHTSIQDEITIEYNKIFEQNIELKHQLEGKENQITLLQQDLENKNNSLMIEKNQIQQNYDQLLEQNKNLLKKQEQLEIILSYISTQIQMLDIKDSKKIKKIQDLEDEQKKKLIYIEDLQNQIKVKNEEIDKFKLVGKQLNEEIERLKKLINLLQDNSSLKTQTDQNIQQLMSQQANKEDINQILRNLSEIEEVQLRYQSHFEKQRALENELNVIHNSVEKCKVILQEVLVEQKI